MRISFSSFFLYQRTRIRGQLRPDNGHLWLVSSADLLFPDRTFWEVNGGQVDVDCVQVNTLSQSFKNVYFCLFNTYRLVSVTIAEYKTKWLKKKKKKEPHARRVLELSILVLHFILLNFLYIVINSSAFVCNIVVMVWIDTFCLFVLIYMHIKNIHLSMFYRAYKA